MAATKTYKPRYASRSQQDEPMYALPEDMAAKVTILARQQGVLPGKLLERYIGAGIIADRARMEDEAYAELDRQCREQRVSTPPRWEFDKMRRIIAPRPEDQPNGTPQRMPPVRPAPDQACPPSLKT